MRFILEIVEALTGAIGGSRVGIKLSPGIDFNECVDDEPVHTYRALVQELNRFDIAYMHVARTTSAFDVHGTLRPLFQGPYVAGAGLREREDGESLLRSGLADSTTWAVRFQANPDLPKRLLTDGPFNQARESLFYTPGQEGYLDYPSLSGSVAPGEHRGRLSAELNDPESAGATHDGAIDQAGQCAG